MIIYDEPEQNEDDLHADVKSIKVQLKQSISFGAHMKSSVLNSFVNFWWTKKCLDECNKLLKLLTSVHALHDFPFVQLYNLVCLIDEFITDEKVTEWQNSGDSNCVNVILFSPFPQSNFISLDLLRLFSHRASDIHFSHVDIVFVCLFCWIFIAFSSQKMK